MDKSTKPAPDDESIVRTHAPDDLGSPRNPENDPVSDLPDIDTETANAPQKGKLVFSPAELNNAGEDKDYFNPKNDHQFDVPTDAHDNSVKPDVDVLPETKATPLA